MSPGYRSVHPAVLREATRLVGGDMRRLTFLPDGSVEVRPEPRTGTGPTPTTRRRATSVPAVPSSGSAVRETNPPGFPDGPTDELDEPLPDGLHFSAHALERCREFQIAPGVVVPVVQHPSVTRPTPPDGHLLLTRDGIPWCVVVTADRTVVVTVMPKRTDKWRHET
jgi:hypothetical protein